jgi:hypothetical protein
LFLAPDSTLRSPLASGLEMRGVLAWFAWLFIDRFDVVGFRSRAVVLLTWARSYFVSDRGARLITLSARYTFGCTRGRKQGARTRATVRRIGNLLCARHLQS